MKCKMAEEKFTKNSLHRRVLSKLKFKLYYNGEEAPCRHSLKEFFQGKYSACNPNKTSSITYDNP